MTSLLELIAARQASDPLGAKTLLIDADRIPYLAALKADSADVDPSRIVPVVASSLREFEGQLIEDLSLSEVPASEFPQFVYLYSRPSFRHALCSSYKANRRKAWSPPLRSLCVETAQELRPKTSFAFDGYEADDLVGILSNYLPEAMIVSNDKDLWQLPGRHYDPQKRTQFVISEEDSRYWMYYQWIRGDTSDGYGGIYGMGEVKTHKFLTEVGWKDKTFEEMAEEIYNLYVKHKSGNAYQRNGILSRILRDVLGSQAVPWRR